MSGAVTSNDQIPAKRPEALRILGKASSINVRKVLWTCDEIGIDYEQEDWGDGFHSTATPEFLAINPNGLVPAVEDENGIFWESNTICRYLAAKYDRADLLPKAAKDRARVEQWMDWQATELNGSWRYAFQALVRKNPACGDERQVAESLASWNRNIGILDQQLNLTGSFVTGDTFTVADIVLGLSINRWLMTPMTRPHLASVIAYSARLRERPAASRFCFNGVA